MTEANRKELIDRILDARDSLEQMRLCFYNGARVENINKKAVKAHWKNVRVLLKWEEINELLK